MAKSPLRVVQNAASVAALSKIYLDGVAATGDTYLVESSANVLDAYAGGVKALSLTSSGPSIPKTAGKGIQVDETWSWRDLEGPIKPKAGGAGSPTWTTWSGNIKEWAFVVNDIVDTKFHWPHDWVPGTDIYIHVHWSHNGTAISGTFTMDHRHKWGKGHGQSAYDAEKTISTTVSVTNIAGHPALTTFITEVQLSAASPSASQIDTDNLEADGLLKISSILSAKPTITGGSLFVEYIDIHYQSSNVGTKNKAPNFHA